MLRHSWTIMVAALGCDGVFDLDRVTSAPSDGRIGQQDDSNIDGAPDAPPVVPFGMAMRVEEITSGETDDDPTVSLDGREIYFNTTRTGAASGDIYRSTRPEPTQPWSVPLPVTALNSAAYENTPRLSYDGLVIHLGVSDEILMSTRPSLSSTAWSNPEPVLSLSSPSRDAEAMMTRDQLSIYFVSNRGGNYDIYVATRVSMDADWGEAVLVPGLNSGFDDESPFTPDGLTMYFSSRRTHTRGSSNLWMATRPTVADSFAEAIPLDELNTDDAEEDPWLSEDGRRIWFASSRGASFDVYTATR